MTVEIPAYLLQMRTPEPDTSSATYLGFALVFVGLVWSIRHLVRYKEPMPLFLGVGGAITSLLEPLFDITACIWYPVDGQWTAFVLFNRSIPMFIPAGWCWNVGFGTALLWLGFSRGYIRGSNLWRWFGVALAVTMLFEIPGTAKGLYAYYGNQPLPLNGAKYSIATAFANASAMVTTAYIAYRLQSFFKRGVMAWTCGWLITPFAFLAGSGPGWVPIFIAVQSTEMSPSVTHGLGVISILLSLAVLWMYRTMLLADKEKPVAA
jgi:hypothetical protein